MRVEHSAPRWRMAVCVSILVAGFAAPLAAASTGVAWSDFRERFVGVDGRVIDTGSGGVSHSEGQGWSMLFAEANDDRASFDRIWKWTREHLELDDSALFAWRWNPAAETPVDDPNNSTDADLTIAWALERAARRWHEPAYGEASQRIRDAIRRQLLRIRDGRYVLLPGRRGFERDAGLVLNPSYLVVPALRAFAHLEPEHEWDRVLADGLELLRDARFGRHGLAPDWLLLASDGRLAPAPGWPPRFGFDAVRVPLYLVWGAITDADQLAPYRNYWSCAGESCARPVPAWVDLATGESAEFSASEGVRAVRSLVLGDPGAIPQRADKGADYYSSALLLLARIALAERNAAAARTASGSAATGHP
jgi:endoglucanase